MRPVELACRGRRFELAETSLPLDLDDLVAPPDPAAPTPWEVEIGFGKGRYLQDRAVEAPPVRLLGVEMAGRYFGLVERRMRRRGIDNVLLVLGEALYVMSTVLPRGFASAVHVYFPDPWPKDRHHKRRLFDEDTVDLLLGLLRPEGWLFFATDHLDYGELVLELLGSHPALEVERRDVWPSGARTNYELKYEREGRPILRLAGRLVPEVPLIHPRGVDGVLVGTRAPDSAEIAE